MRRSSVIRASKSQLFSWSYETVPISDVRLMHEPWYERAREGGCKSHDTFISKSVHMSLLTGCYNMRLERRPT